MGEARVGDPLYAELALRLKSKPINPALGGNDICSEIFSGDVTASNPRGTGPGGGDNAWATFLPFPACTSLDLKLDLTSDKQNALPGDHIVYSLRGRNLAPHTETSVIARLAYDPAAVTFVTANGLPQTEACPTPTGLTCLRWTVGTLAPSGEFAFQATFAVNGGGKITTAADHS